MSALGDGLAALESYTNCIIQSIQEILEDIRHLRDGIESGAPRLIWERTVENPNKTKQHTVMSTTTARTTKKKNNKVYLLTCVRGPHRPDRPVLTKNIGRRIPHIILGPSHVNLTKRLNTDIAYINPNHHLKTIITNTIMAPVLRTRVTRPTLYHFTHVR